MQKTSDSYLRGQAEAQLDIVPGLMPDAYVMGRFDAKAKKNASKNKPGMDWVNDPSVKGGGYYRKSKPSSASTSVKKSSSTKAKVAGGLAAALVVGAGAAAIASRNRSSVTPASPVTPTPRPTSGMNKKVVGAGAGVAAIAAAGGIAAARNRTATPKPPVPESRMPVGAKTTYKQSGDPWEGDTPESTPRSEKRSPDTPPITPQINPAISATGFLPPSDNTRANPRQVEVLRRPATTNEQQAIDEFRDFEAIRNNPNRKRNTTKPIPSSETEAGTVLENRLLGTTRRAKSVKQALKPEGFDPEIGDRVNHAIDLTNRVLNIPGMPEISVVPLSKPDVIRKAISDYPEAATNKVLENMAEEVAGGRTEALYFAPTYTERTSGRDYAKIPRFIGVNDAKPGASTELATIHEIGHFVDHAAIGEMRRGNGTDSSDPRIKEFLDAVATTKKIRDLDKARSHKEEATRNYAEYALHRHEIFARAFTQYVADKSGSKAVKAQIKARQSRAGEYWDEKEYKKIIEPAMEKLFKGLGYR